MTVQFLTALRSRAPLHRPICRAFSTRSLKDGFPIPKNPIGPPRPPNPGNPEWEAFADRLNNVNQDLKSSILKLQQLSQQILQQNQVLEKKIARLESLVEKRLKRSLPTRTLGWNKDVKKRALDLIFGSKKYMEFTPEEKRVVDFYQQKMLEVDGGAVLPNTKMDLEQRLLSSSTPLQKPHDQKKPISFELFKETQMESLEEYKESPMVKELMGDDMTKISPSYEGYCRSRYARYCQSMYGGNPATLI